MLSDEILPDGASVMMMLMRLVRMPVLVPDGLGDDLEEVLGLGLLLIGEGLLQHRVDRADVEALQDPSLGLLRPLVADEHVRDRNRRRLEVVLPQDVDHLVPELVDVLPDFGDVVLRDAAAKVAGRRAS